MKFLPHRIFLFTLLFAFVFSNQLLGQSSNATKQPYFLYKSGFGFATPDSSYSLNIRFRMQNRFLMNSGSDSDFSPRSWDARVRRCRLSLTGHAYSPKLSYNLQLSFSRADMDWNATDNSAQNTSPNVVRDAMIFYRPTKQLTFGFGQGKLPGNRQRVVSSGALQFYDRSQVNAALTLDRDFGFFMNRSFQEGNFKAILKTAVTSGEGRNSVQSNSGLAYTGRIELLPFGDFTDGGDYFEGDLAREEKPKISVAAGYHFNDMAVRSQGQLGKDLFGGVSFSTYLADFLLKYRGMALSAEYMKRSASDSPVTVSSTGSVTSLLEGDGINAQASYCFPSMWEIAGRYSLFTPSKRQLASVNQNIQSGIGVSRYFMKHKVKAQFNLFLNHDRNLAAQTDKLRNYFGVFQFEFGL